MIDCPSCSNEVPQGAPRCKHCFSDLTEHWEKTDEQRQRHASGIPAGAAPRRCWPRCLEPGSIPGPARHVGCRPPRRAGDPRLHVHHVGAERQTTQFFRYQRRRAAHLGFTLQGASQEIILVGSGESVTIEKSTGSSPLLPSAETLAHQIGVASVTVIGEEGAGSAIKGAF